MDAVVVSPTLTIPEGELREGFVRSSGPGGQHVNKSSTKVELRWSIKDSAVLTDDDRSRLLDRLASRLSGEGELRIVSSDGRSQLSNREEARRRLAEVVRNALRRPRRRRKTRPTKASVERRIADKKRQGRRKSERQKKDPEGS